MLHPNSKVEVVGRSGPLLTVDSGGFESGGFGMVAAREATLLAVETAKKEGVAILMLRNCHHIGRVGTYAELAASHGLITTLYTNGNQVRTPPACCAAERWRRFPAPNVATAQSSQPTAQR